MITFKINGTELEMSKDSNISFSFENPIFGFEHIKLSRTQNFTIPKTPHNNTIFHFASRPDLYGDGMRVMYEAALHYSGGKVDGRLYVADADRNNYNAVFVYGELLKLKEIKEAGNIGEYISSGAYLTWTGATPTDNSIPVSLLSLREYTSTAVRHGRGVWNYMPSTGFRYLMDLAASYFGVTIDYTGIEDYANRLAIKLNGMNTEHQYLDTFEFLRGVLEGVDAWQLSTLGPGLTYFNTTRIAVPNSRDSDYAIIVAKSDFIAHIEVTQYNNSIVRYVQERDGTIINTSVSYLSGTKSTFIFTFKAGDQFYAENLIYANNQSEAPNRFKTPSLEGNMTIYEYETSNSSLEYPGLYYLQPNLPEVSLLDMIKTLAYLTGRSILYSDGVISFFDFTFDTEPIRLENNISFDKITRNVGNFAQRNIIRYDSSDNITEENKLSHSYNIDNKTLEAENELYVIPFSEGNASSPIIIGGSPVTAIPDITETEEGVFTFGEDADTLCFFAGTHLTRPDFVVSNEQLNFYSQSTTIDIKEKMYLFEFMKIRHNTLFIYKNNEYVVFSATWQKGVASLKLVKRA